MPIENRSCRVEFATHTWPIALHIPKGRFRLSVAADTTGRPTEAINEFAPAALKRVVVYFCAWGPGLFHPSLGRSDENRPASARERTGQCSPRSQSASSSPMTRTAPVAIQRPGAAGRRTRNSGFAQGVGTLPRLPTNSALPSKLNGTVAVSITA
jgi:hypothetical protein